MSGLAQISPTPFFTALVPYMPVFYVSFGVTLLLTPLMRRLALAHGVIDEPDRGRKAHKHPIAYLGGVAIFLGWLAGILIAATIQAPGRNRMLLTGLETAPGVIAGAGIIMLFGLLDDVYKLVPRLKLFAQLLGAATLFFFTVNRHGFFIIRLDLANMLIYPLERHGWLAPLQTLAPVWYGTFAGIFSAAVVVFIVMGASNALNLLDGLDGLCGGVTGIMALGYLLLALALATDATAVDMVSLDSTRITLSLALLGAVLGFLPFNFNPARIFMGDTGSMFLGYLCGAMMILFGDEGILRWFLAGIVIFSMPLLDTLLAIVRRKFNRQPIFSPDARHFHHFLLRRGYSVPRTVLTIYAMTGLFVILALLMVTIPTPVGVGLYLVLFAWLVIAAFKLGLIFQRVAPVTPTTGATPTPLPAPPATAAPVPPSGPAPGPVPRADGRRS